MYASEYSRTWHKKTILDGCVASDGWCDNAARFFIDRNLLMSLSGRREQRHRAKRV